MTLNPAWLARVPGALSVTRLLDRAAVAGSRPVNGASAAAFRIAFGVLGVVAVIRFAARGWIDEFYIAPEHHFTYSGFWWVQPWPGWGMYAHFALLGLAALGVALGYRYRLSIAAFFLLFTYVELLDKTTYLNHYYLVSLFSFLMLFMPLHRTASLDARRSPHPLNGTVPVWVIWTLRAQLGVVYLFSGIAKLNPDWLFHAQPLRIWLYNSSDVLLIGSLLREPWTAWAMSWAGAAFDLTIVGWLLWRRSRPWAYAVVAVFHVLTWLLFPIGMFPWIMMASALIFFLPDWPLRLHAGVRMRVRHSRTGGNPECAGSAHGGAGGCATGYAEVSPYAHAASWATRIAVIALVLFALVQVLVPLRHWAYPGNVRWNEDGYRFSWRVLLTEKTGHARFRVLDPSTGQERLVYPDEYLTPLQVERMATHPDMILATAHIIARDFESRGVRDAEVRADVSVAFNGRQAAPFIDPSVDLARVEPGIWPKRWVLPGPPER
ncbi:MAG: HTTM domain-containing protein [Chloroflexota bacterium]|nr:HTTM domain-containing protein [Chloroflexota bacterium]